ncbi:unnamed protein product [Heligmosomoides polygyrus]|uniref:C2H2-type domain-containing protein n=1 Tax=Heligmosomoides polygyrus TaxID=6339 RepID=A0A183FTN0_HELPZ|nr:unnamed protein product [Heligmosomoides polygyrus]
MCYGSIVDVSEGDANLASTGLIERNVRVDGRFHRIWIGLYPNPKQQHQMRESSACRGGLFVIDKESHRWLLHYIKLREFTIARHEIEEALTAEKRFFLLYGGRETGTGSVRSTLTRFFSVIGCDDYVISCNTTRHSTAGLRFNFYVEAVIDGLEPAVKEIAQLAALALRTNCAVKVEMLGGASQWPEASMGRYDQRRVERSECHLPVEDKNKWNGLLYKADCTIAAVYFPALPSRGVQFCMGCGKHGRFNLRNHLRDHHQLHVGSDQHKMYEQTGGGIMERLKGASIDLEKISREKNPTYNAFVAQIEEACIPLIKIFPNVIVDHHFSGTQLKGAETVTNVTRDSWKVIPCNISPLRIVCSKGVVWLSINFAAFRCDTALELRRPRCIAPLHGEERRTVYRRRDGPPLFKTAPHTNLMFEWQNVYITSPPYYLQLMTMRTCFTWVDNLITSFANPYQSTWPLSALMSRWAMTMTPPAVPVYATQSDGLLALVGS